MKLAKKILVYGLAIVLGLYLASCVKSCHDYTTYSNTVEYDLHELDDGVYGYYNAVTSNIPAENYEMIVLCLNGQIFTLNGDVNIYYTDDAPKLIWTDVNRVHGDTFDVYVPSGSIEMRPNLVQS
jgi:hypothetical protein